MKKNTLFECTNTKTHQKFTQLSFWRINAVQETYAHLYAPVYCLDQLDGHGKRDLPNLPKTQRNNLPLPHMISPYCLPTISILAAKAFFLIEVRKSNACCVFNPAAADKITSGPAGCGNFAATEKEP